jgi:lysosomal alpha-mannosidase
LAKNPERKFIYVEMAFFSRWWRQQNDRTKELVRQLVNEGRLEFINGGWSMNDEATCYYHDIIDNMGRGLRWIEREIGDCARPRIGWQIDPFGHSREQAAIFAQLGFDGLFIGRDDIVDEIIRARERSREMVWKANPSLGASANIFNSLLPVGYATYPFLCFDQNCHDDSIVDNPDSSEYNVEEIVNFFLAYTAFEEVQFLTKNLIMSFGQGFQFTNAGKNFKNLDKLIYHVNKISNLTKVNLFYSTPSCYLYSLYKANLTEWPVKEDDFFPYASRAHTYWTGFYTSRAAFKGYVRRASNFLQAARHLSFVAK